MKFVMVKFIVGVGLYESVCMGLIVNWFTDPWDTPLPIVFQVVIPIHPVKTVSDSQYRILFGFKFPLPFSEIK